MHPQRSMARKGATIPDGTDASAPRFIAQASEKASKVALITVRISLYLALKMLIGKKMVSYALMARKLHARSNSGASTCASVASTTLAPIKMLRVPC